MVKDYTFGKSPARVMSVNGPSEDADRRFSCICSWLSCFGSYDVGKLVKSRLLSLRLFLEDLGYRIVCT